MQEIQILFFCLPPLAVKVPRTRPRGAAAAAESAVRDFVAAKNGALERLADNMRLNRRYAEVAAKDAPAQLVSGDGFRGP